MYIAVLGEGRRTSVSTVACSYELEEVRTYFPDVSHQYKNCISSRSYSLRDVMILVIGESVYTRFPGSVLCISSASGTKVAKVLSSSRNAWIPTFVHSLVVIRKLYIDSLSLA